MKFKITTTRHKHLGAIGDIIELSQEEFNTMPYNVTLERVEEKRVETATKPKNKRVKTNGNSTLEN